MRKGYLVALPPGAGKTRAVLMHLKRQVKGNLAVLCKNLLVVGPNSRVGRVWLRELCLLGTRPNQKESLEIRAASESELKKRLAKHSMELEFISFDELRKLENIRPHSFVVIDEWHRYRGGNSDLLVQSSIGPLGNHTYFVSATPLNPVMEQERDELIGNPKDDNLTIKRCREQALKQIASLTGAKKINHGILVKTFTAALRIMGIKRIDKSTGWKVPRVQNRSVDISWTDSELEYFDSFRHEDGDGTAWKSSEAAWAIGLIQTEVDKKLKKFVVKAGRKSRNPKVFGHPYVKPYVLEGRSRTVAAQWLWKSHSRVQRLLDEMEECGVIQRKEGSARYTLTGEKALIFCVHQGVARGLQLALETALVDGVNGIACSVNEFTNVDENQFMKAGIAPFVLIATDKLSESIDLHGACHFLVHYELPWSPLRLLQRVGRLTRMHIDKSFKDVHVCHVIIPGSVEEERVNRLVRRTKLLHEEGAWPKELYDGSEAPWRNISKALIGAGPSMHLSEMWDG